MITVTVLLGRLDGGELLTKFRHPTHYEDQFLTHEGRRYEVIKDSREFGISQTLAVRLAETTCRHCGSGQVADVEYGLRSTGETAWQDSMDVGRELMFVTFRCLDCGKRNQHDVPDM